MDKYIGKWLGGRYEIIDVVGVGGMAVVYRARDTVLGRYVAVKVLKDEYAKDPDIRRRFSNESQAVAKLSHNNIVSVFDVGSEGGVDYIVMELIEGVTLKEYLRKKGRLPWQEALFFAQQICRALVHAHSRGIIHQDIKPQNVIILRDGTAKLTDFGIASFATTQETRVVQEAIGSVHYISPEQAKGSKIDYRTDIYSLGVVMYEMLTGKLPFEGETALQVVMQHLNAVPLAPSELAPDVPAGMDEVVMHAMCANTAKRYASAEELYADLERLKADPDAQFRYTNPDDESGQTQVLGRAVQQAARRTPVSPVRDRMPPHRQSPATAPEPEGFFDRMAERPGLAAGIAVAVFTVIALVVAGLLLFAGNNGEEKVAVPSFVGKYIDEVMNDPEATALFTIREAGTRIPSDRPVGEILRQSVDPGKKVAKGTNLELTVSAGGENIKDTYKIVDFKGKKFDYVTTVLGEHEVSYRTAEEFSDEVEKGLVTRTDPPAGQELEKSATLTIYISRGKETRETQVPDLFGLTESEARKALEAKKLTLGSIDLIESTAEKGTVVWQSTARNSAVPEGTVINVQISGGKKEEEPQPEPPENTGGDQPPDAPVEPVMGRASVQVALPEGSDLTHVIILVDGEVKYDQTHTDAGGTVTVALTAPAGQHEVTVSIDGNANTSIYTFN